MHRFISAEMPPELTEFSSEEDIRYYKAVEDHMIHCCAQAENGCLDKNGKCKRGYQNDEVRPFSTLDENGYPTYRRRATRDLKVVPHNRDILLDWDGHINVEYAGKTYTVLYLYKYLFKGNKKMKALLLAMNLSDHELANEIFMYVRGRFICAMDSMWRFFNFRTYPATFPSVVKITVKLPSTVNQILAGNKLCDMAIYFERPAAIFADYKYTQFFHYFAWSKDLPARFREEPLWTIDGDVDFYEDHVCVDISAAFPFLQNMAKKTLYIFSKDPTREKSVNRMGWLYPSAGEIFYLRILLYNYPAMSFLEYRTHNTIVHNTFQESAITHGYVNDDNEAILAFVAVMDISTPAELRALLVMMTSDGFPTLCIINHEELFPMCYADYLHLDADCRNNEPVARNKCLLDLKRRFRDIGKDDLMEACGIPLPVDGMTVTELERLKKMYIPEQQAIVLEAALDKYPNTPEQEELFNLVKAALDSKQRLIVFLQGSAGTGKSTFANKITAYARSKDLIALGCCATALACQVYGDNGEYTTAHDLFGIPVIEDNEDMDHEADITSLYLQKEEKKEVLQAASLFVWDEALSNHKHCLSTAFGITNSFAGKVLILMGDWRQCPPVVKNADMLEIVSASMVNSRLWSNVQLKFFTINLRLLKQSTAVSDDAETVTAAEVFNKEQKEYLEMLDIIGDGRKLSGSTSNSVIDFYSENIPSNGSRLIGLPKIEQLFDQQKALEWLFPNGFDADIMHTKAILCSTNVIVDEWNTVIQAMNNNPIVEYSSKDTVQGIDDPYGYLASMITEPVMAKYDVPGVPSHILRLKVNDICMVMRNLNRKEGLVKNLRVKIVHLGNHVIRVCTLNPVGRRYYNISRIRFSSSLPYGRSVKIERRQFPLRLAYSITFNKSQGQEFQMVLADIRNNPFTHGHLYVALSRIRIAKNIKLFTNRPSDNENESDEDILDSAVPTVINVVFDKLKLL
jgi:hypothetical protein